MRGFLKKFDPAFPASDLSLKAHQNLVFKMLSFEPAIQKPHNWPLLPLFQRFIDLQKEIRVRLEARISNAATKYHPKIAAILEAKQALVLLVVNTWLLKPLDFVGGPEASTLPDQLGEHDTEPKCSCRTQLDSEINTIFTLFHEGLLHASGANPFSTRKFAFVCRMMCADMKLQVVQHSVWSGIGDVVGARQVLGWTPEYGEETWEREIKDVVAALSKEAVKVHTFR